MHFVLLSGGSGKRLWPLSNNNIPKQFLQIYTNNGGKTESMIQRMYRMISLKEHTASITIATSVNQEKILREQLGENVDICIEPYCKDTFGAIILACSYLHDYKNISNNDVIVVCPIDSVVSQEYFQALIELENMVKKDDINLALLGIHPTHASGKYGYIIPQTDARSSSVLDFIEKPSISDAEKLIENNALWNGGVFAFKLQYALDWAEKIIGTSNYSELFDAYQMIEKRSFDKVVVENEHNAAVLRYDDDWVDIGTWDDFMRVFGDKIDSNAKLIDCQNVFVLNKLSIPLLTIRVNNLIIVTTNEGILIADKNKINDLKGYLPD